MGGYRFAEITPEMEEKLKPHFTIIGRRWFEKTNGNTYHSVEVYDESGKQIVRVPLAYGYGDQYRQTALDALVMLGIYPNTRASHGGYECYRRFNFSKESGGDGNLFSVSDVARKKDL